MYSALVAALNELGELDRRLVLARYCDGQTSAALGAKLGIPASTVRTRVARSLAALRKRLDHECGGRAVWGAALVPVPVSLEASVASGKAIGGALIMGTISKTVTSVGVAVAVAVAGGVWWTQSQQPDHDPPEPQTATAGEEAPTNAMVAANKPPAADIQDKRQRYDELRKAILVKRAARERADAPAQRDSLADDISEQLDDISDDEVFAIFRALGLVPREDILPVFGECVDRLPKGTSGTLALELAMLNEPDLGSLITDVVVEDDTIENTELVECFRETAFTSEFAALPIPVTPTIKLNLDMDSREFTMDSKFDGDELNQMASQHPDWIARLLEIDEMRDEIARMFDLYPESRHSYPDLYVALQRASDEP